MGEVLKKIKELNRSEKTLQSVLGEKDIDSKIKRIEKIIFALAEEIDKKADKNLFNNKQR